MYPRIHETATTSVAMANLMALAAKSTKTAPAIVKPKVAIKRDAYTINTDGKINFKNAPKPEANPYAGNLSANNKIIDLNKKIEESAKYLDIITRDLSSLRGFIATITKANQTLRRIVVARNQSVLDVTGVFSGFRVPRESTDLSSEGVSDRIRTRVSDSVYRNAIRDFASFVTKNGYVLAGTSSSDFAGISTADIDSIIRGVRAARALKLKYEITSLLDANKQAGALDTEVSEYTKSIATMREESGKLERNNRPTVKFDIPAESYIDQKHQDVRIANINAQKLESDITALNSRIKMIKDLGSLTTSEVAQKIPELEAELAKIKSDYQKTTQELVDTKRSGGSAARNSKVFKLQDESLARKRAEKLNQLQGRYSRLAPSESKARIVKEMRAWEKVEKEHIADMNARAGRDVNAARPDVAGKQKQLDDFLKSIDSMTETLKIMRMASKQTAQERATDAGKLKSILDVKRAELKNASKKIARREAVVKLELDEDVWAAKIAAKLESAAFLKQAKQHNMINFMINAIEQGADKRTREMMTIAWGRFKLGKRPAATTKAMTQRNKKSMTGVHFGSKGFIVDPRFPGMNSQMISVIVPALTNALRGLDADDLELSLLPAVMDTLKKTPDAMLAHRNVSKSAIDTVNKQLFSAKSRSLIIETVEALVANGKIQTPNGARITKKYIESIADSMLGVIKNAKAVSNLAVFAWPSYREEVSTWIRNAFRIEQKSKKG